VPPIAIAAALVAAAIHVWFFVLESLWFGDPAVFRRFGVASEEQARIVRSFAYNQGFHKRP
jgi:putative membrane protein